MPSEESENLPSGEEIEVHRADRAYRLQRQGKSLSDIALLEGFSSPREVSRAINNRFSQLGSSITSLDRENILKLQLDRLDELMSAHYESALYGDLKSGEFVLHCMDRQIKLLKLDAPDADSNQQMVLVVGQAERDYVETLKELVDGSD